MQLREDRHLKVLLETGLKIMKIFVVFFAIVAVALAAPHGEGGFGGGLSGSGSDATAGSQTFNQVMIYLINFV